MLYGQSVGSGPTCDLATRLPALRGVVLHSPILSGLRVMYPVKRTYWFDIYKVTLKKFLYQIISHLLRVFVLFLAHFHSVELYVVDLFGFELGYY